ncbi:hypothetical protein [Nocardia cyriacigeorgica]|uniref:Uncharacterized protein n=1 Tax=Nocardia cyriacigeorgica (strain GUH-2) TaxID=1127134 RepID=H6RAV8_NOCCG|nr:hypothetical protein [Nocardia cyriacigeorgica]BDT84612.1 hypothetical protein FMUAM8_03760 [Nocardia cyriacigeorgica]CCF61197.1 membrane protein of unknown function [Nocardia cyriacigeorgica GUH-2]
MRSDRKWAIGMAVAPIALTAVSILSTFLLGELVNSSMAADIAGYWMFVMFFLGPLFIPGIVITLIGAAILGRRAGAVLTLLGLLLNALVAILLGYAGIEDALTPRYPYEPSWTADLTLTGATIYAIPFLLLAVGSAYAMWIVWTEFAGRAATASARRYSSETSKPR